MIVLAVTWIEKDRYTLIKQSVHYGRHQKKLTFVIVITPLLQIIVWCDYR